MNEINWGIGKADAALIDAIVNRAVGAKIIKRAEALDRQMDLIACHLNGCPLDLPRLLEANDFNLAHDIYGLARHMNRDNGKLTGCFLPRFAQKQHDPA